MLKRTFIAVACVQAILGTSATRAQEQGALQAVGIFQQACLPFAGDRDGLRTWIQMQDLQEVPPEALKGFSGGHPAKAFAASTPDVKMVIVSEDSGACRVVVEHADPANVKQALAETLIGSGITISKAIESTQTDPMVTRRLYHVASGPRKWLLSVTSHVHSDAQENQSEIILLATSTDNTEHGADL